MAVAVKWTKTTVPGLRRWGTTDKYQVRVSMPRPGGGYRLVERTITARTLKEAKAAKRAIETEIHEGTTTARNTTTFGALLDDWLESKRSKSPTTYERYESLVRVQLKPTLGNVALSQLTTRDLDRLYASLLKTGLSAATVVKVHRVVRQALEQARKWELAPRNVALDATPPHVTKPIISPPSPEVAQSLVAAAREDNPVMAALMSLSIVTGIRRGEAVALRWSDVDLDAGSLRVARAVIKVRGGMETKTTKTDRVRTIALDRNTVAMLKQHKADAEAAALDAGGVVRDDGFMFSPRPGATESYAPTSITQWFDRLRRRTGVSGFSWKDATRHLSATQLVGAGVDVRTVAGRLGHSNVATTLNVYSAYLPERDREAAEILSGIINQA